MLSMFMESPSYTDAPCEHSAIFLDRLDHYMAAFVTGGRQIFGRVTFNVVRLECQQRGCLHAHILLWVHPDDVEEVTAQIRALIPE